MIVQEPVQAAIWDALNHYDYGNATFLAERLFAEVVTDESQFLLATCYYRAGKPAQSYAFLQTRTCSSPECKYLLGRSCVDVGKSAEAEVILAGNILCKVKSPDEIETEFGKLACHVFALLGAIYKSDQPKKAIECYKRSLKLNPLMWSSFKHICELGEIVDPNKVFHHMPGQSHGVETMTAPLPTVHQLRPDILQAVTRVNSLPIVVTESPTPMTENVVPVQQSPLLVAPNTKLLACTPDATDLVNSQHTPENMVGNICDQFLRTVDKAPMRQRKTLGVGRSLLNQPLCLSPLSPSFGVLPQDTPSPNECKSKMAFITPLPVALLDTNIEGKAPKKAITRRAQNQHQTLMPKPPMFSQSSNTNTQDVHSTQNNPPIVRRSSRLFGGSNSSSVKENNKSQSKSRLTSPKAAGRKSKSRLNKSKQDTTEMTKGDPISDVKPAPITEIPAHEQIRQMQAQSLDGALCLLRQIGTAYLALAEYDCWRAIELFRQLPPHQLNTGWALCQIGRAYFELQEHHEAEKTFSEVRQLEPYRTEDMEIYSTVLWHLHRDFELSALAQDLVDMEKNSPEAWCATGNCFSLQKEHDTAIKFFKRAIQVSPSFPYAYTLMGHEYIVTEELDNAIACFRNAIRVNSRHYNAWYGLGLIYYKQEKLNFAEMHFRKALLINPNSSTLLCHIGVVQHAQHKSANALVTLNKAIAADPRNPTCKFHRASVLLACDQHQQALADLNELKKIIPKESLVYFLTGKIHKKMGATDLALMNFSWALDLDPKGLNNHIKEAIVKHYSAEEDSLIQINELDLPTPGAVAAGSNSSLLDPDEILQAVESDESL